MTFTSEDPDVFAIPWSAGWTYLPGREWLEICLRRQPVGLCGRKIPQFFEGGLAGLLRHKYTVFAD
jgi:hypothetical protein